MDRVVTQFRCERTASEPNFGAGAKSIWMYGNEFGSSGASVPQAQPAVRKPSNNELSTISIKEGTSSVPVKSPADLQDPVNPPIAGEVDMFHSQVEGDVDDDDPAAAAADASADAAKLRSFDVFKLASQSLLWMSYRKGFMPLEITRGTSDSGWGCMLRSGQMLMAQTLVQHCLGTDWLMRPPQKAGDASLLSNLSTEQQKTLKLIAGLFVDHPQCPFSVHNIARLGMKYGVKVGSWFSPTPISLSIRDIVCSVEIPGLTCLVASNCSIYLDEVRAAFHRPVEGKTNFFCDGLQALRPNADGSRALQLIVPLRLGVDAFDSKFVAPIASLFHIPQFVGIVGGEPHSSLFFFASQENYLYFLNPHVVQPALEPPVPPESLDLTSYLPTIIRMIHGSKIDPSLALGFYFRNEQEFDSFFAQYQQNVGGCKWLFSVEDSRTRSSGKTETLKDEDIDADEWEVVRE